MNKVISSILSKITRMGILTGCFVLSPMHASCDDLKFDTSSCTESSIKMPDGTTVAYKGYENIFYVKNVEDSTYQTLNIYVPDNLKDNAPILLRTYVGGYMAATAKTPSATDATGRALQEGYVVCIPGSRGANSVVMSDGKEYYTGNAPAGLLDLKAAVRYLKYNDEVIPGNSNKIITDGTSAGGAMSSLLGTTGNAPEYEEYLKEMGAADATDNIWAAVCYCPITDLNHADMEYEWLYGCTNTGVRHLNSRQIEISNELAAMCPAYINSLNLRDGNGNPITADNYKDYLAEFLIASAQKACNNGCVIPDSLGFTFFQEQPQFATGRGAPSFGPGNRPPVFNRQSDFVTGLDLDTYLSYVATRTPLKTPPAFDQWGVLTEAASPENRVFGDDAGNPANFTDFSLRKRLKDDSAVLTKEMDRRVRLMNTMDFIENPESNKAPHWYIRHGAVDRDTSFLVPVNLATKLNNNGYDVDFFLPWNRPHSGDYNLDELFTWLNSLE